MAWPRKDDHEIYQTGQPSDVFSRNHDDFRELILAHLTLLFLEMHLFFRAS